MYDFFATVGPKAVQATIGVRPGLTDPQSDIDAGPVPVTEGSR